MEIGSGSRKGQRLPQFFQDRCINGDHFGQAACDVGIAIADSVRAARTPGPWFAAAALNDVVLLRVIPVVFGDARIGLAGRRFVGPEVGAVKFTALKQMYVAQSV